MSRHAYRFPSISTNLATSILRREHDRHDASGDTRICRIVRLKRQVAIVIVDLEERAHVADLDCAEIVLAVRIVAFIKILERSHSGKELRLRLGVQGFYA